MLFRAQLRIPWLAGWRPFIMRYATSQAHDKRQSRCNFHIGSLDDCRGIGGGREGRPRQSRISRMASGGRGVQRVLTSSPHRRHSKTSNENARLI